MVFPKRSLPLFIFSWLLAFHCSEYDVAIESNKKIFRFHNDVHCSQKLGELVPLDRVLDLPVVYEGCLTISVYRASNIDHYLLLINSEYTTWCDPTCQDLHRSYLCDHTYGCLTTEVENAK